MNPEQAIKQLGAANFDVQKAINSYLDNRVSDNCLQHNDHIR